MRKRFDMYIKYAYKLAKIVKYAVYVLKSLRDLML